MNIEKILIQNEINYIRKKLIMKEKENKALMEQMRILIKIIKETK